MFLVMTMVPVGAIDEGLENLEDAVEVDEEERANRQRAGGGHGPGRGAAEVRRFARRERDDLAEGDLPEQVAEEDEEKERPEKRHEAIGVFLERRADHFDAKEFENRLEEVPR